MSDPMKQRYIEADGDYLSSLIEEEAPALETLLSVV